jgi:hypothetical protein
MGVFRYLGCIMKLLYLDDSGSTKNPNEEYFVLAGVCISENSIRWLSHKLDELATKVNPINPDLVEFHAAEIFSGSTPPWNKISKPDRIQLIKDVLATIKGTYTNTTTLLACAIHKASYPSEDPVVKAYEDLASRFNMHLERTSDSEKGLIILDNTSYETGLQQLAAQIRREGNRWGSYTKRIVEVPLFIDSRAARLVQFADHIAYAVFRYYNAGDMNYFRVMEDRFDRTETTICGLAHLQKITPSCLCPACLTRR